MVERARENMAVIAPEAPQTIEVVLADAGYISEKNRLRYSPLSRQKTGFFKVD